MQICHMDLKLENTLLDGSLVPRLKICDFGYSKVPFRSLSISSPIPNSLFSMLLTSKSTANPFVFRILRLCMLNYLKTMRFWCWNSLKLCLLVLRFWCWNSFQGTLNDQMKGFCRSSYEHNG